MRYISVFGWLLISEDAKGGYLVTIRPVYLALALSVTGALVAHASYGTEPTVIDQIRQRFSLSKISILSGDVVNYINHDDVQHNIHIIASDGTEVDRGLQNPGQTIVQKFDRIGEFTVRCSIHQKMKMKVEVRA
jgi:plastocyanin